MQLLAGCLLRDASPAHHCEHPDNKSEDNKDPLPPRHLARGRRLRRGRINVIMERLRMLGFWFRRIA